MSLRLANVIEHLRGATAEGFLPNDNRGNGSKSWDRSQPPVGGIMVREVYRRYPERWFLEAAFDPLLEWNRWWPRKRLNEGLLSYGSHEARNPFDEPDVRTKRTAGYESGMDDSPMYEDVPFNPEKNTLELQDVGLTSLYIADCRALAELARVLGRSAEAEEFEERARRFSEALDGLWVEERGYYLNYRTDLNRPSERRSPTLFYPLLAGVCGPRPRAADDQRAPAQSIRILGRLRPPLHDARRPVLSAAAILERCHLATPELPHLPGVAEGGGLRHRDRVVPPLAWTCSCRNGTARGTSAKTTPRSPARATMSACRAIPSHSWGGLFGIMAFIEAGYLGAPEGSAGGGEALNPMQDTGASGRRWMQPIGQRCCPPDTIM